jgi:thiamine-phosphate pyrophosphorylase
LFPLLYAIVDEDVAARHGYAALDLARAYLRGGARLLQIRAKQAGSAAFLSVVLKVVADAGANDAIVIVNDRADIAALAGATGVHVGQDDLSVADVRRAFPGVAIVGLSTHTTSQVDAAVVQPASYVAVGPVYGTGTKDTGYDAVGLDLVRHAKARMPVDETPGVVRARPVVAIGGITLDRAPEVLAAGASSVAVISDLLSTGDPEARVRAYVERLEGLDPALD